MLNTGLRINEALAITVEDIDFEKSLLNVSKCLHYYNHKGTYSNGEKFYIGSTKGNRTRKVPLNEVAKKAIFKQLELRGVIKNHRLSNIVGNLLFTTKSGAPMVHSTVDKNLCRIVKKINMTEKIKIKSISSHVLRHTFATRCYEAGIPLIVVQKYLGHSNINITTSIYIDSNSEDSSVIKLIEKMSELK